MYLQYYYYKDNFPIFIFPLLSILEKSKNTTIHLVKSLHLLPSDSPDETSNRSVKLIYIHEHWYLTTRDIVNMHIIIIDHSYSAYITWEKHCRSNTYIRHGSEGSACMGRVYDKKQEGTIQNWMIIVEYKFHPESDDKKHPILDANCTV